MQRGITQTRSSHSLSTLLPCNFSVECPTHPSHITAPSLTPPTHWKTLHASTSTATWPKYTAPLCLLFSACSDTLYALTTTGFPLCHRECVCVFAWVNVLHVHPTVYPTPRFRLVWNQQRGINHSYDYYNLHFNLSATNVKAGRGVAFRETAWGKAEAETRDLGATVWRSVTKTGPGPVNTSSHSVTEKHRRQQGGCVWAVAASAEPVRLLLSLLHCLPAEQSADRKGFCCFHYGEEFQISHTLNTFIFTEPWTTIETTI